MITIARELVSQAPGVSYFALHKLVYLFELDQVRRHGKQVTDAFFVRQKDGPYCTGLHPNKLKKVLLTVNAYSTDSLSYRSDRAEDYKIHSA